MITDIVSADSYLLVNKKAAKLLGLMEAVYFSTLLNIGKTVVRKKKFDQDGFFQVSRKFIEDETTITIDDQRSLDQALAKVGLVDLMESEPDKLRLHADKFEQLLVNDDIKTEKIIKEKAKVNSKDKAAGKKAGILQMLKDSLAETDSELRIALEELVEVLYEKGICKKIQVQLLEDKINNYNLDRDNKLALIKTLTLNGWKNPDWAMEKSKTVKIIRPNLNLTEFPEIATKETLKKDIII